MKNSAPHQTLWTPSEAQIQTSGMGRFIAFFEQRCGLQLRDSDDLAEAALADIGAFWEAVWDFCGVIGKKGATIYNPSPVMKDAVFFPEAHLNYAENLLRLNRPSDGAETAIVFTAEDHKASRLSWDELDDQVSRFQQALAAAGVTKGDVVGGVLPNCPEAIIAMLATVSLGAVWASASPDFGSRALLDRFEQVAPKVLFVTNGYWYGGKTFELADKINELEQALGERTTVIGFDYLGLGEKSANSKCLAQFLLPFSPRECQFLRVGFNDPLFISFSSGTTGKPKCILHRSGGVLLQHLKEHALHCDVRKGDRLFYFTTLSWMMWNWLASGLASGATLYLFDGSPFHPKPEVLIDYAETERITHFGTSAKYLDQLRKTDFRPKDTALASVRVIMSTGSPLHGRNFDYVYEHLACHVQLSSISGGTDILSCFVCGDPTKPVISGEIQGRGLGMDVAIFNADGTVASHGEVGELVCLQPFPSMPIGLLADHDGSKMDETYFQKFQGVWSQNDLAERRETNGYVILGRSDTTLNPGGVRIGTAEIYAAIEDFPEIREMIVVGYAEAEDEKVVLFVTLAEGIVLDEHLTGRIKLAIKSGSTPRHVPALIIAVPELPKTANGKLSENAVRSAINRKLASNSATLSNPRCLAAISEIFLKAIASN